MATLCVRLPDGRDMSLMRVLRHGATRVPPELLEVAHAMLVHEGNYATVYRGTLSSEAKTDDVVLKFVFGQRPEDLLRLETEYKFYQKLEPLQGRSIPRCYGLFQAPDEPTACLVLEYCGESLSVAFDELVDMDLRLGISDCLVEIHVYGVQHNDVEPRNIVVKDGSPKIIGFAHASDHECGCTEPIHEGAFHPNQHEFGCTELFQYACEACIWRPGHFMVAGVPIPEWDVTSVEAVEEAARERGVRCNPEALRRDAVNAVKLADIIEEYGGYRPREDILAERGIYLRAH